jgi:hypothetical protein
VFLLRPASETWGGIVKSILMKPGYLTLPTVWRGCTWLPVTLQWLNQDGAPINLTGWVPRAFTRHFDLNARVVNAATGVTAVSMGSVQTSDLAQGVEDWDWVWLQQGPTGATLPPMLKGKLIVRHPVTNPEALTVTRVGGGCNYMRIDTCIGLFNPVSRYDIFADTIRDQLTTLRKNGHNHLTWMMWFSSGMGWPDPSNPPQIRDVPKPHSVKCPLIHYYHNGGWEFGHTTIPWHAQNPQDLIDRGETPVLQDATLSPVRKDGRPSHQDNLISFLNLLNELGFEELHVRAGEQGLAAHNLWVPKAANDLFINAQDVPVLALGQLGTLTYDLNGYILGTVYATRETFVDKTVTPNVTYYEPSGGGAGTVWFKIPSDNHWWSFQCSKYNKFLMEAFKPKNRLAPNFWDLTRVGVNNPKTVPPTSLVFYANTKEPDNVTPITTYYIRISVGNYAADPAENYPDFFRLNYGREYPNELPIPTYPVLPSPPTGWQELQYIENSAFIRNVASLVQASKGALRVVYDLGVEQAMPLLVYNPVHRFYCLRLWIDWVNQFGPVNSIGFSALPAGYGIGYMINLFKAAGMPLPGSYGIDSYGQEYAGIKRMYGYLKAQGVAETRKKIRIMETYYNDPKVAQDLRKVIKELGINFGGISQWPVFKGIPGRPQSPTGEDPYFADAFPYKFDQYINL